MTASALPNASLTTLEFLRRAAGMSRPELAERSGVSVATILASERSGRVPHLATARRLAHALHLTVDELFRRPCTFPWVPTWPDQRTIALHERD
jgi:transcriptional regulator with XRE-family HTH domain